MFAWLKPRIVRSDESDTTAHDCALPNQSMAKIFDTKDAVPADVFDDYVEHEGKWHNKSDVELVKERGKKQTILTEKQSEKTAREAAEAEVSRLKNELAAKESGMEPAKLEAYAAPFKTEAATEKAARIAAEAKLAAVEKLKQLRKAAQDAGMMMARVDDEDNTEALMRRFEMKDGALVSIDKDGNVLPTAPIDVLKGLLPTKPYLFPFKGGSGGGGEHSESDGAPKNETAAQAAQRFNAERAAAPNPLAPPKVAAA